MQRLCRAYAETDTVDVYLQQRLPPATPWLSTAVAPVLLDEEVLAAIDADEHADGVAVAPALLAVQGVCVHRVGVPPVYDFQPLQLHLILSLFLGQLQADDSW